MGENNNKTFLQKLFLGWSGRIAIVLALLGAAGLYLGQRLQLKLSLTDLLPADHPSVVKFEKITDIVGGVGFLTVVLKAEDGQTHFKVLPSIRKELNRSPLVRNAFYDREEYFFSTRMLYYVNVPDLKKLDRNIRDSIRDSRRKAFDLGLWDDDDTKSQEIDPEIKKTAQDSANVLPYLESDDSKEVLLMIKPTFDSTDFGKSKELIALVKSVLKTSLPAEVTYDLSGRYFDKIEDSEVIEQDIFVLGTIAILLISILLLFYLRSIRAVMLVVLPILCGIGITLGIAYLTIGHINIVTGFLLGILMGLGADYSIHLAFRLRLEKAENSPNPVWNAITHSGHAIFIGALAASMAFYLLCLSDFRAFSEFGFICGTGIGAVMISLLLSFSGMSRFFGLDRAPFAPQTKGLKFPQLESKRSFQVATVATLALCVLATQVGFEYNFEKMLQHSEKVQRLNKLVDKIYGRSSAPSVLAVPDLETAKNVESYLKETYVPKMVQTVVSGATIIPEKQAQKRVILRRIKNRITKLKDKWLERELDIPAASIRRWVSADPFVFKDLPIHLQEFLQGRDGNYYLMLLYPSMKEIKLHTAEGVRKMANMIKDVETRYPSVLSGSDSVVFAEILDLINRDGTYILAGILGMVLLIIWLNMRNFQSTMTSFLPLLIAFPVGMGLMAVLGIKFNIFNIAIIPSFVAIGIDVPIHIAHRAREIRSGFRAARDLAAAVNLTLATTGIGFGVLIFSRAGVLRSLGWLALLGTLAIWWVGMFLLPAVLERMYQKKGAASTPSKLPEIPSTEISTPTKPVKAAAAEENAKTASP